MHRWYYSWCVGCSIGTVVEVVAVVKVSSVPMWGRKLVAIFFHTIGIIEFPR